MTAALDAQVEIIKLARLLGVEPDELGYLRAAQPDDIRRFRDQVTDVLFDGDRARLGAFVAGSRVIPAAFAATVAERALGPVLCARLTALIDPDKAVEIAQRLPAPFLAEVAVEMDPRRAKDVIAHVPADLIEAVGSELGRRGEAVTMGRFVAFLEEPALRAAMRGIDDLTLLQTAFVMEGKERLDHIVALMPAKRLRSLIVAANEREMWPETLDLLARVSRDHRAALVKVALEEDLKAMLPGLLAAVQDSDGWETGLRLLVDLPEELKAQIAPEAQRLEKSKRKLALQRARELGLLDDLGPIGEALSR
jgi:hypothetical protein